MNVYFNRIEWGKHLLILPMKKKYTAADLASMVGFLMCHGGRNQDEAISEVWKKVKLCSSKWHYERITESAKIISENGYKDVEPLKITKAEAEAIKSAGTNTKQKILFVLLCHVKYRNALNADKSDWTTVSNHEIMDTASIKCNRADMMKALFELKESGYFINSKKITSNAKRITYRCETGEAALYVNDLRGLGAVWDDYANYKMRRKKLKHCVLCDMPYIDGSTNNNFLYCEHCRKLPKYAKVKIV